MNMRAIWWRSSITVMIGALALLAATPQAFAKTSTPSVVPITGTVGGVPMVSGVRSGGIEPSR